MTLPPETQDLALRLVAYEAVEGTASVPAESAAVRAYEKLRRHLCALVGVAGFRSLASRAVALATSEAPSLRTVQVTADGSLQGLDQLSSPQIHANEAGEGGVILIAHLLGLLLTFIGETLTLRLVQDVWPDAVFDDHDSADGRKA